MEYLGMELNSPDAVGKLRIGGAPECCVCYILGTTYHFEVLGNSGDGITMTHPHLRAFLKAFEKGIVEIDRFQIGTAVFS